MNTSNKSVTLPDVIIQPYASVQGQATQACEKRLAKSMWVLLVALLVPLWLWASAAADAPPEEAKPIITLEVAFATFSEDFHYTVNVFDDGRLHYFGDVGVHVLGHRYARLSKAKVRKLIETFKGFDIERYADDPYPSRDAPHYIVTMNIGGQVKKTHVPAFFRQMEQVIQEDVDVRRWISGGSRTSE